LFLFVTASTSATRSGTTGTPAASRTTAIPAASGTSRPSAGITAGSSAAARATAWDSLKSFAFLNGCGIAAGKILRLKLASLRHECVSHSAHVLMVESFVQRTGQHICDSL
jgi:hypothetical protein